LSTGLLKSLPNCRCVRVGGKHVKRVTQHEVSEGRREFINWLIKVPPKREINKWWKIINCLCKAVAKREVDKRGREVIN